MENNKLLLHICCAGCGVYVSKLLKRDYDVTLFFYNPNVWPETEYDKRLAEAEKIAEHFDLKLIKGENDHDGWLKAASGHENDPEKGGRCLLCYGYRLERACRAAKKFNCASLTTTLTMSPHKAAAAINAIGEKLAPAYGVEFLERDFKKQDGFKKSSALSRELNLYRQNYCGCDFSRRK